MSEVDEIIKTIDRYKMILEAMKEPKYEEAVKKYQLGDVSALYTAKIYVSLRKLNKEFTYLEATIRSVGGLR